MALEGEQAEGTRLARAARGATVFYFVCCALVLPVGVAAGVVGLIHLNTASAHPGGDKTAGFRLGDDDYFNTPGLLAWRNRLLLAGAVGSGVLIAAGATMLPLRLAARTQARRRRRPAELPPNRSEAAPRPHLPEPGRVEEARVGAAGSRTRVPAFMKRKRPVAYGVLATMIVVGLAVTHFAYLRTPRGEQIRLGISAIEYGMTEQQVDALMPGPPDERQRGNDFNVYELKVWRHGTAEGRVGFKNGRVQFKTSR